MKIAVSGSYSTGKTTTTIALWKKHTCPAQWKIFRETMEAYGAMVRQRLDQYDLFIHLPIEFPLTVDGHRPVNERFRSMCDRLLRCTYTELALPVYEVSGSILERLESVVRYLQLSPKMDIHEAIVLSEQVVKKRFNSIKLETQS
jgi:nicotinamide riboside kinase